MLLMLRSDEGVQMGSVEWFFLSLRTYIDYVPSLREYVSRLGFAGS